MSLDWLEVSDVCLFLDNYRESMGATKEEERAIELKIQCVCSIAELLKRFPVKSNDTLGELGFFA